MDRPHWLGEEPLQQFFAATRDAGGQARAVGGCVRDYLMGIEGADIDIASTLTPQQTIALAAQHGWKAIPTGIDHGTVTLVLPGRVVEVTTLRRDVATDGRRATIAYTDRFEEDAARRDFTINALYMDAEGTLYDFFDGEKDIAARRVAFIGDAVTRIREDGLRILRFFRFLASHGTPPADEAALAACAAERGMIDALSGERIANEMRKLLSVPNPAFALRLMAESGVAPHVFLTQIHAPRMVRLHMLEAQADHQTSVWARVAAVTAGDATAVTAIAARWKLSRHETQQLCLVAQLPPFSAAMPKHAHTRLLRLHGAPAYLDWLLVQATLQQGLDVAPYVALARDFIAPVFPVTAKDLLASGMREGKALGEALTALEQRWEESDYRLDREALLSSINAG